MSSKQKEKAGARPGQCPPVRRGVCTARLGSRLPWVLQSILIITAKEVRYASRPSRGRENAKRCVELVGETTDPNAQEILVSTAPQLVASRLQTGGRPRKNCWRSASGEHCRCRPSHATTPPFVLSPTELRRRHRADRHVSGRRCGRPGYPTDVAGHCQKLALASVSALF